MRYEEVEQLRKAIKYRYTQIKSGLESDRKNLKTIQSITGTNTFVTIFDYRKRQITFHCCVQDCTGYNNDEFTISAINNEKNSPVHIIHPDDIEHKIRFDYILIFKMMKLKGEFPTLKDNYTLSLRIITKGGEVKRVFKESYFFEVDKKGFPVSQLDIWKIIPNEHPYVKVHINYGKNLNIMDTFYKFNREILQFDITKRQIEIMKLRYQRMDNKTIANELNLSLKTVENHIRNLKMKMENFYIKNRIREPIYNMNDMIHFINKYSIFSFQN